MSNVVALEDAQAEISALRKEMESTWPTLSGVETEKTSPSAEWKTHADKIVALLTADAESRQQALALLDSFVDILADTPDAEAFQPIFKGIRFCSKKFITPPEWYSQIVDRLYWSERRDFEAENILSPLYNCYFRLFPEKIEKIPSTFGFDKSTHLPEYIKAASQIHTLTLPEDFGDFEALNDCPNITRLDVSSVECWTEYETPLKHIEILKCKELQFTQNMLELLPKATHILGSWLSSYIEIFSWDFIHPIQFLGSDSEGFTFKPGRAPLSEKLLHLHVKNTLYDWEEEEKVNIDRFFNAHSYPNIHTLYLRDNRIFEPQTLLNKMPILKHLWANCFDSDSAIQDLQHKALLTLQSDGLLITAHEDDDLFLYEDDDPSFFGRANGLSIDNSAHAEGLSLIDQLSSLRLLNVTNLDPGTSILDIVDASTYRSLEGFWIEEFNLSNTTLEPHRHRVKPPPIPAPNSTPPQKTERKHLKIKAKLAQPTLRRLHLKYPQLLNDVIQATQLESLRLTDLKLNALPDTIGQLTNLKELHLWRNQLTTLPDSFQNLKALQILSLSHNSFTSLPPVLGKLPNLKYVYCRGLDIDPSDYERYPSISFICR